ncbi:hypothetical protein H2200_009115 [Cladophialophora chaetospira]|uniref:Amidoligase enzyme n=1 Tax=Cladophialophora chaetospira TaxID=386627 RepID=A0AA38X3H5_9EURO|nr:hypothetical protein H2200_009115 [Cladophialophora chaetospira]
MTEPGSDSGKLPLTFGIEVEFLFGVRRDLERFPEHWWLVSDNIGLYQAAAIFGNNGGELRVENDAKLGDDSFEKFASWGLTHEGAVRVPVTVDEAHEWSNGALAVHHEDQLEDEWDWTGLELISPALRVPDIERNRPNGLAELNGYLKFMTRNSYPEVPYMFMASPQSTSVHVHIGVQPQISGQVDIPLDVLRHIAWVCLLFEDSITLLHHPERHAYPHSKCRDYAASNRKILNAESYLHHVHCCGLGKPFSPEDTFLKIFDYKYSGEWLATVKLAEALSSKVAEHEGPIQPCDINRYLFVNFENLALGVDDHSKKTIEFRQHHGTLSARDLNEWVIFVTALVRAAERLSSTDPESGVSATPLLASKIFDQYPNPIQRDQALREAAKYTHILREDRRSLKQLFDLLQLPLANRVYWWNRAKSFQAEIAKNWTDKIQSTCDDYECPNKPLRDSEGWEEGELDNNPPWDGANEDCEYELDVEEEEDDSVPMEIDNDVPDPDEMIPRRTTSNTTPSLVSDDDDESVPMDIDDDVSSPVAPTAVMPPMLATNRGNVMSISHILNHYAYPASRNG